MMDNKQNLQLYFKEFVKTDSYSKGVNKIKKTPDYVCDLFVYEPRTAPEAQLGSLFMLGRIENIPKNKYRSMDLLLNLLISVIKREFYSDYKRSTLEAFEFSLNKANLYLADFAEKGNDEWIGNLNFICGVFSQNILHITQIGESIIKLFRGTTINHIENKFPAQTPPHPLKTFNNIASGSIINGDKIILATKDIIDIAPIINLKKLAKGNYCQIIESLKNLAENKPEKVSGPYLVLEARMGVPEEIISCIPGTKDRDELKSPKNLTTVFIILKKISAIILFICRKIYLVFRKIFSFIIFIFRQIYKFLAPILSSILKWFFRKISKTDPLQHKLVLYISSFCKRISLKTKNDYRNLKTKLIDLKNQKIISFYQQNKPAFFIASLLTVLILILPLIIFQQINSQVKIKNFNELSAEIQEIQKKADTALIYSEKERARGLIQKNQALLINLLDYFKKPPFKNNKNFIKKASELQEKHQEQQDSVNNVKRISNLEEILDLSKSGFIVNPVGIDKFKDNLYFFEFESGILYKFNLGTGEKDLTLIFISAKDELRKITTLENGETVLFGQSGKIYLYNNDTNEHMAFLLDPTVPIEKIKDVENFLSNFYVLDIEQGNIIKYTLPQKEETIIKGSNWLSKPSEEFKNAQSIAVDDSVFILNSSGIITKYFRGEKTESIKLLLEQSLGGDNEIFIKKDFKNFYISDPKNKRLIVLNKEGGVINQYINDEFINLRDFFITSDEKEIYLLCSKKVYKLKL